VKEPETAPTRHRPFETIGWRTAKPISVWAGSRSQVPAWLSPDERRTWLAWVFDTRLFWDEIEHDLQRDSQMSFADSDISVMHSEQPAPGAVDAIDSEAATFLLALHELWRATGDTAAMTEFAPCIDETVSAMEALQDFDGLTWAKPTWKVKYLMNEAEVFSGYRSAVTMARAYGDEGVVARATEGSERVAAGLALLWNPATGGYDWAVHANGARIPVDWRILYPDGVEQAWVAVFGLSAPVRSRDLMEQFVGFHPAWAQPTAVDLIEGAPGLVGYWPIAGWGLLAVGDRAGAKAGAASIRAGADAARWAWPLDIAAVGALIVLDSGNLPVGLS